jgi:hypothetical protein
MKGQGISINVIIIAAIALLVLVILSVLLLRSGGDTARGISCEGAIGGRCISASSSCIDGTEVKDNTKNCPKDTQVCCVKLGS